uniref:Uncharacterized protein n=1 Tax=Candidatus Kentrum sp. MB TaxID=2138164 RepID=A0A450XCE0_9GAMM|nr:MAG: hypothetical protein BECKMB1821G_GA0114241_102426 [Candidatus Kentron sp. MB]
MESRGLEAGASRRWIPKLELGNQRNMFAYGVRSILRVWLRLRRAMHSFAVCGNEKMPTKTNNLLTLPVDIGKAIIEARAVIACPLLGTDRFVDFCRKRDLSIDRTRLVRLECLGLFAPVFRVRTPEKDTPLFHIPIRENNNWFDKGWAWDTTGIPPDYEIPNHENREEEGYYSIFQIDWLDLILREMTLSVQLDNYLDSNKKESIDWQKNGVRWMQHAEALLESSRTHEYRRSLALLCQFISNRYYPKTQTDQRTIRTGGRFFSDRWININVPLDWDWHEEVRNWDPCIAERQFDLTPEKLRHAFEGLAVAQESCDPVARWYPLVQFISINEREKLKGAALRAETLRAGAHMLRFLHKDLYGEKLPHPNEVARTIIHHIPELEIRQDTRRYLEFVTNCFAVNPQPKLVLFVEGESEDAAVKKFFEGYWGVHPGGLGIEIIVLGGVGTATGTKREDRFRAIVRLIDYLHHHQTVTFLVLDNENNANKLKKLAQRKSKHIDQRYVTRPEYIHIWEKSFEFDNFSCDEIATAMNQLAQDRAHFSSVEVGDCKKAENPGRELEELYRKQANYELPKVRLNEILIEYILSDSLHRKIEDRPIIQVLRQVADLAGRNPFPTSNESWEFNQSCGIFG